MSVTQSMQHNWGQIQSMLWGKEPRQKNLSINFGVHKYLGPPASLMLNLNNAHGRQEAAKVHPLR